MENQNYTDTFTRLRGKLRRIASSILRNEDDADDALQEAFCRLWAAESKPASNEIAEGAAVLTVKRICIDFLRARSVLTDREISDEDYIEDKPESVWDNDSLKQLEESLLMKLPQMQRTVFKMVSEGIDYDIIALRLGISESNVRQLTCRARKTLRTEYKKLTDK